MSGQINATDQGAPTAVAKPPLKRAPTLYAIIVFKIVKGILFLAFGVALYFQATHDLPTEWGDFLNRPLVEHVFERLRIHPENRFFLHIARADRQRDRESGA